MRTRTLIAATLAASALILAAGIAVGVSITDASQGRTAQMPAAAPRYEAPAVNLAQIIETCAWQQATFYAPLKVSEGYGIEAEDNHRAEAYAWGRANCEASAERYGVAQLIEAYAVR